MKKLLILLVLAIIGLSGCLVANNAPQSGSIASGGTDSISGMNQVRSLKYSSPTIVSISGINNRITVEEDSNITELSISRIDNNVYVPTDFNGTISQSGINTQVIRY